MNPPFRIQLLELIRGFGAHHSLKLSSQPSPSSSRLPTLILLPILVFSYNFLERRSVEPTVTFGRGRRCVYLSSSSSVFFHRSSKLRLDANFYLAGVAIVFLSIAVVKRTKLHLDFFTLKIGLGGKAAPSRGNGREGLHTLRSVSECASYL